MLDDIARDILNGPVESDRIECAAGEGYSGCPDCLAFIRAEYVEPAFEEIPLRQSGYEQAARDVAQRAIEIRKQGYA